MFGKKNKFEPRVQKDKPLLRLKRNKENLMARGLFGKKNKSEPSVQKDKRNKANLMTRVVVGIIYILLTVIIAVAITYRLGFL